jgi:hypothetical protein
MRKRLICVEGDDFTGWCCSHCTWGITTPRLESTVAALAFNRLAQHSRSTIAPTAPTKTANPVLFQFDEDRIVARTSAIRGVDGRRGRCVKDTFVS